jgi:hypothetical protein
MELLSSTSGTRREDVGVARDVPADASTTNNIVSVNDDVTFVPPEVEPFNSVNASSPNRLDVVVGERQGSLSIADCVKSSTPSVMNVKANANETSFVSAVEPYNNVSASSCRLGAAANERRIPSTLRMTDCKKASGLNMMDVDLATLKDDELCGWGPFKPQCCQVFRNAKVVLFCLCILATVQVCIYIFSNVISSLRDRYRHTYLQ